MTEKRPPVDVAIDVLKVKYPQARLAFVAGSFHRGEATAYSDIDLVVIFDELEHAWRESFMFEEWPVEAFIHDPETVAAFCESDVEGGEPYMPSMILEGTIIPGEDALGRKLKAEAAEILKGHPPEWDEKKLASKRYSITDIIDDLRDPRNAIEAAALVGALHEQLGDFYFRSKRMWSAARKHIPRKLQMADPDLAERWNGAFLKAWSGDRNGIISLTEEILKPYGGLLFDGYRLDAAADKRVVRQAGKEPLLINPIP